MTCIKGKTSIILSPPDEIVISYELIIEENDYVRKCDKCKKEKIKTVIPHVSVKDITIGKEEASDENEDAVKATHLLKKKWHEGDSLCRLCWGETLYLMEDKYAHDGQVFFKTA